MKTWRKEASLLLVGMMLMSGLVAISAPAIADKTVTVSSQTVTAYWADANMVDHPELIPPDESLIINTDTGTNLIYLGDDNTPLSIDINVPNTGGAMAIWRATMSAGSGNAMITVDTSNTGHTLVNGTQTVTFNIDVAAQGVVETAYPMICTIANETAGNSQQIAFSIYVSSLMHVVATPDKVHDLTMKSGDYIQDNSTGGDAPFEAGDKFKETRFTLHNNAPFTITDPQLNLTAPTGFTLVRPNAKYVGDVATTIAFNLNWRMDVAAGTPPGVYKGTAILNYQRTEAGIVKNIREDVRPIDYTVDYNFKDNDPMVDGEDYSIFQCYATNVSIIEDSTRDFEDYVSPYTIPSIEQSTYTDRKIKVNVTITNNGNTPLYNVRYELDPAGWDYFRNPRFFWDDTNGGVPNYDTISDTFDLAVGASRTFTIEVFVDARIPIGEHRLPILYDGFYFDDGSLGGSTGFMPTNGGNHLEVIFAILVTDSVIQCYVDDIELGALDASADKLDIRAEQIEVTIVNDEEYNFIDVMVRANFTATPWYQPIINMRSPWIAAIDANPAVLQDWDSGGDLVVTFPVDTDPSFVPDRYPFQLEITAVIEETLEVVTTIVDYTQGAVIDFTGYGPDIYVTAFTADDIVPGQPFVLDLTLQNVGDDTLRDVTVMILTEGTEEYDWDLESTFKEQFDWSNTFENWGSGTGGQVTWNGDFPEDMFYTLEDLDVDNVREIVEINLYMDGVYSEPSARISIVHILDLAPGATINVVFDMITDKDMVNGKPYDFPVTIDGIGADAEVYHQDRMITVQSSLPGDSYNPVELNWFDAGLKALALFLFFIIVLAILLFVYNMFKGDSYDEDEEDFDFEDEPFEPTPAAPAKKESGELVEP
jgi:cbb3-type cytochrome oxidase subunit 3